MKAIVVATALIAALGAAVPASAKTDGELRVRNSTERCDGVSARQSDPACRGPRGRARRSDACQTGDQGGAPSRECDLLRRGTAGAAVAAWSPTDSIPAYRKARP